VTLTLSQLSCRLALLAWVSMATSLAVGEGVYDTLRIEAVPPVGAADGPGGGRWTILLDGHIDALAPNRLGALVAQKDITSADVYFNSPGGSLIAGMAIGRLLRQRGFDAHVGKRTADVRELIAGVCYSACPFAYAGGVRRYLNPDSVLGVHRAANRVPLPDEDAFEKLVSQQTTEYLLAMGVSPELFRIMSQVPHDVIRGLTRQEAERLMLVNE
jgi:hypothetical protein